MTEAVTCEPSTMPGILAAGCTGALEEAIVLALAKVGLRDQFQCRRHNVIADRQPQWDATGVEIDFLHDFDVQSNATCLACSPRRYCQAC